MYFFDKELHSLVLSNSKFISKIVKENTKNILDRPVVFYIAIFAIARSLRKQ